MTVTYSLNVANAKLTGFTKLLLRWRGSIYKLLYREVIIYIGFYYLLSMTYRYFLNDKQKLIFEKIVEYCRTFTSVIPLSFVLGFYVSIVFMQIPWPDKAVFLISGYVRGDDDRGRIIRRTLARYLILMQVLTFQAVSTSVRRRFPTLDHIQEVGLFTPEERLAYDEVIGTHGKWWVPVSWFTALIIRARRAGRIKHDYLMDKILEELHVYRTCCGMMFAYDWISIPLVYTQTVSIATYVYFVAAMIGRQYLDHREGQRTTSNDVDYYIPVFTILEFLCFMGWLKVAEVLINPYGEDEDDFELNWCLDRNLLVSYTVVDEMYNKHPKLVEDMFWDKREPILPYTKSSISTRLNVHPHLGSTVDLAIEPEDFLPMETIMEDEQEDYDYSSVPNTSMVDYNNTQQNWFQPHQSVQIQMDPSEHQEPFPQQHKFPAKDSNVSRNHSELIEGLRAESRAESNSSSRGTGVRFIPDFIQDSKIINRMFGSRPNSSQNSYLNANLPNQHFHQNYSNLAKRHPPSNTFMLKTPTKRQRAPQTASVAEPSDHSKSRLNPNQSLMVNSGFSMNASNASIGGTLNAMHNLNNFNTSLSATTMNNSQHLASSSSNEPTGNASSRASSKLQGSKRNIMHDDLTSSNDDQRYETTNRNHRNLRLNRTANLSQNSSAAKYSNLPTAPVLSSFNTSSTSAPKSRMSPFMNRLRNSLNFSSHHYRNLNKLSSHNKGNSFSSAISLKSKCDNPTSDQLVTPNGFHFPQQPPKNLNQYLPLHLKQSQECASALTLDQENELNNNVNNIVNLNRAHDTIEIKISSPSSRSSHRNLNSTDHFQSLENLDEEDNLIVMDDLNGCSSKKEEAEKKKTEEKKDEVKEEKDDARLPSNSSTYTISTAAAILKASNENELTKLKSSVKPVINNQDSQPMTSGTLTGETLSEKSTSTHSSLTELNQENRDDPNENQSLLNKTETETSSSSNETNQQQVDEPILKDEQIEEQPEEDEQTDDKSYSPNEDCHEERYEESPTSSTDSLSPYESNQNTVSSYTQLLEKEK